MFHLLTGKSIKKKLKKTRILLYMIIVIIGCLLLGCSNSQEENSKSKGNIQQKQVVNNNVTYDYFKDITLKDNEVLVYNSYKMQLGIYNTEANKWNPIYNEDNVFAYRISGDNTLFSIGNSLYNKFSLIKNNNIEIKSFCDIKASDSIIPIGKYKNEYYYIYNVDDLNDNINRKIVKYDEKKNKFTDILKSTNSLLSNAVFVKDQLYYTVYISDKDVFNLYRIDMKTKQSCLEKEDMATDFIYEYNDELVYDNGNNQIVSLTSEFCYTLTRSDRVNNIENNLFFQIYASEDNDIECLVTDFRTLSEVAKVSKFIGYRVENDILYLYCNGKVEQININK